VLRGCWTQATVLERLQREWDSGDERTWRARKADFTAWYWMCPESYHRPTTSDHLLG